MLTLVNAPMFVNNCQRRLTSWYRHG